MNGIINGAIQNNNDIPIWKRFTGKHPTHIACIILETHILVCTNIQIEYLLLIVFCIRTYSIIVYP